MAGKRRHEPRQDHRQPWQIAQAARCGCKGTDDFCACQNEEAPWKYGLGEKPSPPESPTDFGPFLDWLDALEGFATRRERMVSEIATAPSRKLAWLRAAYETGFKAGIAAKEAAK